ncbi:PASTA domain-containing protein [Halosquirtibacter laminarini]|uniref:PASTA domain-containing protein n=1 Tax=Halosquirtibacter laminarini TaxID=3374600 RepID=A0AC61ND91_9BACT|nr:PASTA domain-containing protein [Prolixibacteraceae bacterium]
MSFKEFTKSRVFIYNIIGAFVLIPLVVWITMFSIRIYTRHGESIILPDYSGQNVDVVKNADNVSVRILVADSIYRYGTDAGTIIEQTPRPGEKVKPGRKLFVTVAASNPKEIIMPKLVNGSIRNAKLKLKRRGLKLGKMVMVPSPYEDLVLTQSIDGKEIEPGKKIYLGSIIDLTVGTASHLKKVDIPNLDGSKLDEVKQILDDQGLSLGAVIYDGTFETTEDSLKAYVSKQRPSVEQGQVKQGSFIDVWLKSVKDTIILQ